MQGEESSVSFFWVAIIATLIAYWIYRACTTDNHIAGRRIYSYRKAASWQCSRSVEHFYFGGLRHPWADSVINFLLVGSIGSGKTTLLRLLAQEFLTSIKPDVDRRGLVYDPTGNMLGILAGMKLSCPVVSLHPYDARGVAWDMAADITTPGDALQLGSMLIPQEKGGNAQFFSNAATSIVTAVVEVFQDKAPDDWRFADVLLAVRTRTRLQRLLEQSPRHRHLLSNYFGNSETGFSVLATVQAGLAQYSSIAAGWSHSRHVSIKHWANGPMPYILVLGQNQENKKAMDTVNRLLFSKMVQVLLNQTDSSTRRTFLFLDEVREAAFQGLSDLYTRGRAKGVSITSGFQSIEGLREAYGTHLAHELAGQNLQLALLRVNEAATAEWMSKLVGDKQFKRETVSRTSSFNAGTSTTRQSNVVTEPAVLPSTFMDLPRTDITNGLSGLFLSSAIGAWWHTYSGKRLFSHDLLSESKDVPNFVARPTEQLKLIDWTSADLLRLGFPPDLLDGEDDPKPVRPSPRVPTTPQIVGKD